MGCRREKNGCSGEDDDHMKSGRKSGATWQDSGCIRIEDSVSRNLSWIN